MIAIVIGGARSGKSRFAENFFADANSVCYIATAEIIDEEMRARVQKHIDARPSSWRTCENPTNPYLCIDQEENYILDDITNLISNIMFNLSGESSELDESLEYEIEKEVIRQLDYLLDAVNYKDKNIIMVSNEVGMSIVPMNRLSRVFRDIQGRVNQYLAQRAESVYFIFAGIEVKVK
ncbi:MAG: bifunctional adenosylcobinamide kinase/adenosylcobinamide-phosphate guanylyltransferase [Tissierellia bacterium]|nr:bifunctional adenosylcobinamide kinase/adenosylcobinamide-phosphate guanylyltransferase [Tissierellia bacterium]